MENVTFGFVKHLVLKGLPRSQSTIFGKCHIGIALHFGCVSAELSKCLKYLRESPSQASGIPVFLKSARGEPSALHKPTVRREQAERAVATPRCRRPDKHGAITQTQTRSVAPSNRQNRVVRCLCLNHLIPYLEADVMFCDIAQRL